MPSQKLRSIILSEVQHIKIRRHKSGDSSRAPSKSSCSSSWQNSSGSTSLSVNVPLNAPKNTFFSLLHDVNSSLSESIGAPIPPLKKETRKNQLDDSQLEFHLLCVQQLTTNKNPLREAWSISREP